MAIDVADVITDFGAYYKPGSDNQKNLRTMIYKPGRTASYFQLRPTEDTIWRGTLASLNRIVQPFQKTFSPISTTKFTPNHFDLFKLKIDLQETPDDLEATYLGFLAALPEADRAQWPFVIWWLSNLIPPAKERDLELNEYFAGVYLAPPVPGTAGAVSTAMNGIRKVIRGYNTAGRLNLGNGPFALGAFPGADADFCTYIETFVESIPSEIRPFIKEVFMDTDSATRYKRGKRDKYKLNINYMEGSGLQTVEDYPSVSVVGLDSHLGSQLIWTSFAENRIRPVKKIGLKDTMKVQQFAPRVVSAYTDWWEALNFEVPEFVFCNDQDLA
ncbi:MAG: hypothetical protein ABI675_19445 [Chitinophagaceae bacterium]